MPRDAVDPDSVENGNERRGCIPVGASSPCNASWFRPRRIRLENLPGLFPLVIARIVSARTMLPVRRPRRHGFADLPRTLRRPDARAFARRGLRQFLVAPKSDDADPLIVGNDLIDLDADPWVGPHPLDLLARRRETVETLGLFMKGEIDGDDVR